MSASGSDWVSIKFLDVASGKGLEDELKNVKFSCQAWLRNDGFFYNSQ